MTDKEPRSDQAADLRRQAEEIAREKAAQSPGHLEALSPVEIRQTLHELQVHQIELEMQNEELRRAQAELEGSRARYFDLYDLAPVGYCTLSEQGLILEANLTAATLLGVAKGAMVKQPLTQFIFKEDQDIYYHHRKHLIETGAPQAYDLRLVKKDATPFWARLEATAAQDADGETVCRASITDITERKQAEDALRFLAKCGAAPGDDFFQSLARYLARSLGMDYVCIDRLEEGSLAARTVAIWFDGKFENNVSYTLKDTPCGDVVGETICCFPAGVRHLFPKDVVLQEMLAESYVGTTLWSSQGQPIGLIAIIGRRPLADPTLATSILQLVAVRAAGELERRHAEEALRHAHHRLTETLNSITDAFFSLGPDFVLTAVNPAAERDLGKTRDELLGRNLWEQFPEAVGSRFQREFVKAMAEDTAAHFEEYYPPFRCWFEVHAYPSSVGLAVYFRDITERKLAEKQLREAKEAAEVADRAKDLFLAVLSHELRTPLTPIVATASLLLENRRLDADTREALEVIRRNAVLEARLIDDLLDVTRIARGKVALDRRLVELGTILDRAAEVCRPDLEVRRLKFTVDIKDPPHWVHADSGRLQQVFWNLLTNAIKFTPPGGCVGIRCWREETQVVTQVSDTGMGIEPEVLPRLFQPFEQGGAQTTREFGGLGLGLTICKAMMEMHGGTIEAFSQGKGKGATFTVKLPICPLPSALEETRPTTRAAQSPATRPLRILVVEDHGDSAWILRRMLATLGHEVQIAGDMATALRLAADQDFDLLLSDLGLPDGSGCDLIQELRARGQSLPAIAFSGYGLEQDIAQSLAAGFSAHLIKPASLQQIQETIAAVVR